MMDRKEYIALNFTCICSALYLVASCELFCQVRWPMELDLSRSAKITLVRDAFLLEIILRNRCPRKIFQKQILLSSDTFTTRGITFIFNQSRKRYIPTSGLNSDSYFIGNLPTSPRSEMWKLFYKWVGHEFIFDFIFIFHNFIWMIINDAMFFFLKRKVKTWATRYMNFGISVIYWLKPTY